MRVSLQIDKMGIGFGIVQSMLKIVPHIPIIIGPIITQVRRN
jgi:hypothetical protein